MSAFYLAGPFFTDEQRRVMGAIEHQCASVRLSVFSPRIQCLCPPDASPEQRQATFKANIDHIRAAPWILARIDDFDPGTMWELGYAYSYTVPVYAFTTVKDRGLNLMIAESGAKFLQGMDEVMGFISDVALKGDFSRGKVWKKDII